MDTSIRPYAFTKGALYDRRVVTPAHQKCRIELLSIELATKKGRWITLPRIEGCAGLFAGVVYRLTTAREIWANHGILSNYVPGFAKHSDCEGKAA